MPTYLYECQQCKKEFEEVHSISIQLEECPFCKADGKEPNPPKRLIAGGAGFILNPGGVGWSDGGYSGK